MSEQLRRAWTRSRLFRLALGFTVLYTLLRLAVHDVYLVTLLSPDSGPVSTETPPVPIDLQVYLDAANHLVHQEHLYLKDSLESIEYHYPYPPPYALLFIPFLERPPLAFLSFIPWCISQRMDCFTGDGPVSLAGRD